MIKLTYVAHLHDSRLITFHTSMHWQGPHPSLRRVYARLQWTTTMRLLMAFQGYVSAFSIICLLF